MNDIIEMISAATSDGATAEQKNAAASACRHLAAALETQQGQPLGPQPPTSPLAAFGRLDFDQALDLVIGKLRAKLGSDAPTPGEAGAA